MSRTPTHADAELILKLYDLRREPRMREARRWFMSSFHASTPEEHQALCPPGSEENASYRMVTTYWSMAASFVVSGVLHPELFYQNSQEMMFVWERVRELVPRSRELYKNPLILRNIEEVAKGYLQWWEKEAPEFYPTFSNMVRNMGRPQGVQPFATEDDEAH